MIKHFFNRKYAKREIEDNDDEVTFNFLQQPPIIFTLILFLWIIRHVYKCNCGVRSDTFSLVLVAQRLQVGLIDSRSERFLKT